MGIEQSAPVVYESDRVSQRRHTTCSELPQQQKYHSPPLLQREKAQPPDSSVHAIATSPQRAELTNQLARQQPKRQLISDVPEMPITAAHATLAIGDFPCYCVNSRTRCV